MPPVVPPSRAATVLGPSAGLRVLTWAGAPLLGAGIGSGAAWLLALAAGWALALPWTPFEGPLELITSFPEGRVPIGGAVLGVLGGLALALLAEGDYVTVTVGDDQVAIARGDRRHDVHAASVGAVFLDGRRLVLLGPDTEELAAESGELPNAKRLAAAFAAHGYPWAEADPHRGEFRRWVVGHPGLSAEAHAFLKARARALEKDEAADAEQLREELAALGVVVRDEGGRQFWRRTGRPPGSPLDGGDGDGDGDDDDDGDGDGER
ncbi:hypothetical protein ACFO4E_27145 [Nocardiopsis mangrovi]|uniref:DUF308 domain-containing protein n=1 Tax=Nocardiopsis mangrovi TaxID=1179818 RepID=A0ABV9E2Z2_9ACTN